MRTNNLVLAIIMVTSAATQSGCGGDGSGSEARAAQAAQQQASAPGVGLISTPGGIEGTGIRAKGLITARDSVSITVNGTAWNIAHAAVTVDGVPADASTLDAGNSVTIAGTTGPNAGLAQAQTVAATSTLIGPIQGIQVPASSTSDGSLLVLGLLVSVGSNTTFGTNISGGLAGLHVGDLVRISTGVTPWDALLATRVELAAPGTQPLVTGVVRQLATSTQQFQIYGLPVSYEGATLEGFPAGGITNGDTVRTRGRPSPLSSDPLDPVGPFIATEVDYAPQTLSAPAGTLASVCGAVTRFVSTNDFDVDGQPVTTTSMTGFAPSPEFVMLDASVCVEGTIQSGPVVVAALVEVSDYSDYDNATIQGTLESVDMSTAAVRVAGVSVEVQPTAVIRDVAADPNERPKISLGDLHPGDYVRVAIANLPAGENEPLRAIAVERRTPSPRTLLEGPLLSAPSSESVMFLTLSIKPTNDTIFYANTVFYSNTSVGESAPGGECFDGKGHYYAPCNAATFFAIVRNLERVSAGEGISAAGTYLGANTLAADVLIWTGF